MKNKFIYHDPSQTVKYPNVMESICDVFQAVADSKYGSYFGKTNVHFYSGPINKKEGRNFAFMMLNENGNPDFFFSINGIVGQYKLQSWLISRIAKSPVFNANHAARLCAGHEIGHYIILKSFAKRESFGYSVHIANIFLKNKYYNLDDDTLRAIETSDTEAQMLYRDIFVERWADRISRTILGNMPEMGRSADSGLFRVHISGITDNRIGRRPIIL